MLLRVSGCKRRDQQDPAARELSFLERLGMLVDQQWNWPENQALGRHAPMVFGIVPECRSVRPGFSVRLPRNSPAILAARRPACQWD
jgi:hypothetical protein